VTPNAKSIRDLPCRPLARKSLVYFHVNLMEPLPGAVYSIAVSKKLFLQHRDVIFGGSHLVRKILGHE
jgi:hypothetical protein